MYLALKRFRRTRPVIMASVVLLLVVAIAGAAVAAEGTEATHGAMQMKDFLWRVVNFILLAALVIW